MKSLAGGSYSATQNPTGAVAKSNQNAATQPPTVVIQATGSAASFSYKDDCYLFNGQPGLSVSVNGSLVDASTVTYLGAGKLDATGTMFTGLMAAAGGSNTQSGILLSVLTGANFPGYWGNAGYGIGAGYTANPSSAFGSYTSYGAGTVWVVRNLVVSSPVKCYA